MSKVSISDKAKALIALEAERKVLYARARKTAARQEALIECFRRQMQELSQDHHLILAKLSECEKASDIIALGD